MCWAKGANWLIGYEIELFNYCVSNSIKVRRLLENRIYCFSCGFWKI